MQDLERVRFVTKNYEQLQGLKWVPLGLYFCLYSVVSLANLFSDRPLTYRDLPLVAVIILVVVGVEWAHRAIGRYYRRRFGQVRHRRLRDNLALPDILGCCLLLIAIIVNWTMNPPVDLALLAFGTVAIATSWPDRRFRVHYIVMMVLVIGASFLPLLGVWSTGWAQEPNTSEVFALVLGLYWVIGGVFDHLLLVRTMKVVPEESDAGAV